MNDRKQVVGIQYEVGQVAPTVVLKGTGETAEQILKQASSYQDLRVVRDPELVKQLYRVPVDEGIGSELFPAMAVLLVHVLELDQQNQRKRR